MEHLEKRTDEQLVALYTDGNNSAFDILLERYKDKIYSYIFYSVRNADLADDLFQETFVKAIMTIRQGRYTENGKFGAWLSRIAHNLVIDVYRTERNECIVYGDDDNSEVFDNTSLTDAPIENDMVNQQTLSDVKKLMDKLPENQREVVFMRFYQELSFKEISDATGVSINTALGRMRYAILNMRKMANDNNLSLNIL